MRELVGGGGAEKEGADEGTLALGLEHLSDQVAKEQKRLSEQEGQSLQRLEV